MSKDGAEKALSGIRQRCLSKGFNKNWKKLVAASDADALLLSQDSLETWKTTVEVKNLDLKNSSANVNLGSKEELLCLYTEIPSRVRARAPAPD